MTDSIWRPPEMRGLQTEHRHATWTELFFDLIFVVAIAQLSARLIENVTLQGVLGYAFVYTPIWLSWVYATMYSNRFDSDDLGQKLITFGQMLMVAAMAASVAEATPIQFAAAIAVFRLLVGLSYFRVRASVPAARDLANRFMVVMFLSAAIWIVSTGFDGALRNAIWGAAIALEVVAAFLPSFRARSVAAPLHLHHLPERFGLFTIIVLGETVLAVVAGVAHAHFAAPAAVFGAVALTISFALWWIYFEELSSDAIAKVGSIRAVSWVLAHLPFVIGVTALGVALEAAVLTEIGDQLERAEAGLFAVSIGVALIAVSWMAMSATDASGWGRLILERLPAVALAVFICFLPLSAQVVLVGVAMVVGLQAIHDVRQGQQSLTTDAGN